MLTLTDTASLVVRELVERRGGPDTSGLRISTDGPAATEFAVAIVPEADGTDVVVEQDGARVFLGGDAAPALDDKTLDARVDEEGRVAFDVLPPAQLA